MPPIDETPPTSRIARAVPVDTPDTGGVLEYVEMEEASRPKMRKKRRPPRMGLFVRAMLLLMALGFATVLAIAIWLRPYDEDGQPLKMATHTQLGMPPCNMLIVTGKPCPACGMTTSFSLLAHGDVANSLRANWVGTLLATFTFALIPWGAISAIRGRLLWLRDAEVSLTITAALILGLMVMRWLYIFFLT